MTAFYNEIDPYAAEWLRNLIAAGRIAPGVVDERDIRDIKPEDLRDFTQCHFFAGIGVWSHALRNAGWPDDRPVWTGSCPSQPFSAAGRQQGTNDGRHLWPVWFNLIRECAPPIVLGEQVEAAIRFGWLDLVQTDLEGSGYACGAVAAPAAGFGAPHIRARLYFAAQRLADATDTGFERRRPSEARDGRDAPRIKPERLCNADGLADAGSATCQRNARGFFASQAREHSARQFNGCLPDGHCDGGADSRPGPVNGFWRNADWLYCRDDRWRPVEPGLEPLAHGAAARVGRLRAYGNAICTAATNVPATVGAGHDMMCSGIALGHGNLLMGTLSFDLYRTRALISCQVRSCSPYIERKNAKRMR